MQQQPGMPSFSPTAGAGTTASQHAQPSEPSGAGGSAPPPAGSSIDHEGLSAGGDEGDRSGSAGNRWPRQETLALLKIRSEMDAAFREAALKGPLWEQVSRKLAAMGYNRSPKKCREKFENVDKYYKRTKDGRAGRSDGKAYRFFSELEALHGASSPHPPPASLAPNPAAMAPPAAFPLGVVPSMAAPAMHRAEPPPPSSVVTMTPAAPTAGGVTCMMTAGDVSFSSSSDGEDTDQETGDGGKRKRRDSDGGGGSSKMMRFFEGLMRQVMERQEEMQQRFIEAIERREQDRMIRDEAWRRQEVARLAREQDALAQERAMAASRDAAVVAFIQRITGQTIPMPPPSSLGVSPPTMISQALKPTPVASAAPAPPPQHQHHQTPSPVQPAPKTHTTVPPISTQPQKQHMPQPESKDSIVVRAPAESQDTMGSGGAPSPSRWPKAEVHALIQLRTELEARYQDNGPKGPLWEDISAGMRRLGYNRRAKRCKEKWENINKYFKKVKDSNKRRPEDSKTCPYYNQLDALYRSKALASSGAGGAAPHPRPESVTVLAAVPLSQTAPHQAVGGGGNKQDCSSVRNGNGCASSDNGGGMQTQGSNGGVTPNTISLSVEGGSGNGTSTKKEDNIMMKETPQPVSMNDSYVNDRMDAGDSDSMDDDEDDFDEDEDEGDVGSGGNNNKTMQYEIQFQRQHQHQSQSQGSVDIRPNASGGAGSGPGPATRSGSFLTMVHH